MISNLRHVQISKNSISENGYGIFLELVDRIMDISTSPEHNNNEGMWDFASSINNDGNNDSDSMCQALPTQKTNLNTSCTALLSPCLWQVRTRPDCAEAHGATCRAEEAGQGGRPQRTQGSSVSAPGLGHLLLVSSARLLDQPLLGAQESEAELFEVRAGVRLSKRQQGAEHILSNEAANG